MLLTAAQRWISSPSGPMTCQMQVHQVLECGREEVKRLLLFFHVQSIKIENIRYPPYPSRKSFKFSRVTGR